MYIDKWAFALTHRHAHTWIHMIKISSIALMKSNNISWISGIINRDKDHKTILEAPYGVGDNCNTISIKCMVRMKVIC